MKKVLSILVVVLALTLALGCFAFADEFGGAGYEEAGYAFTQAQIDALVSGGIFEKSTVDGDYLAPTCKTQGYQYMKCLTAYTDAFGKNYEVDVWYQFVIDTCDHNFVVEVVDKAPTCVDKGLSHHKCEWCPEEDDHVVETPATGVHDYCDIIEKQAATCLNDGWGERICNVCKDRIIETIPHTNHADPAKVDYKVIFVKTEPTCTADGEGIAVCPWCDGKDVGPDDNGQEEKIDPYTIPKLLHDFGPVLINLEPTCTATGEGYHECSVCGIASNDSSLASEQDKYDIKVGDYETLEALGHLFVEDSKYLFVGAPATCEAPGYNYYVCARKDCGTDATGADISGGPFFTTIPGKPVVDENGLEFTLTVENTNDIVQKVLWYAPLGHDFLEWVCVTEPDTTNNINGYWTRTCGRTGCTKVEDFTGTLEEFEQMLADAEAAAHADDKNGLYNEDGEWKYYKDDVFQSDFVGMVSQDGCDFFVADGKVCMDANGLNMYEGEWYFLSLGRVCAEHTGLALYDGCWFFITNGKLDTSVTGLVDYNGGTFVFADGRLVAEYSGLYFDGTDWYFAANGQIQKDFSGSVVYDGETFVLENGKLVG